MEQLFLLDVFDTVRTVKTRAWKHEVMEIQNGIPDPVEAEVRGIPCVIDFNFGFATHAVRPPGSLFWSETGYRSWVIGGMENRTLRYSGDVSDIIRAVEYYIDEPVKRGGRGGKLVDWWPLYVCQWRENRSFELRVDRGTCWNQWGPAKHRRAWANFDRDQRECLSMMISEGIDPNDVGAPPQHRGPWPKVTDAEIRETMLNNVGGE